MKKKGIVYTLLFSISLLLAIGFAEALSCSLSVSGSPARYCDGTLDWQVTSSPIGYKITWYGTKDGIQDENGGDYGQTTDAPFSDSGWSSSNIGSYTRYVKLLDSGGNVVCTTNTVSTSITDCTGCIAVADPSYFGSCSDITEPDSCYTYDSHEYKCYGIQTKASYMYWDWMTQDAASYNSLLDRCAWNTDKCDILYSPADYAVNQPVPKVYYSTPLAWCKDSSGFSYTTPITGLGEECSDNKDKECDGEGNCINNENDGFVVSKIEPYKEDAGAPGGARPLSVGETISPDEDFYGRFCMQWTRNWKKNCNDKSNLVFLTYIVDWDGANKYFGFGWFPRHSNLLDENGNSVCPWDYKNEEHCFLRRLDKVRGKVVPDGLYLLYGGLFHSLGSAKPFNEDVAPVYIPIRWDCSGCKDSNNVCQAGNTNQYCGINGASCQTCNSATHYCYNGACVPTNPPCALQSPTTISPSCSGGSSADCEPSERITMSGTYTGDCSAINLFQIDAASSDNSCTVQYSGGSISPGISADVGSLSASGGTKTSLWTIPAVPSSCAGKTVTAGQAKFYRGSPPELVTSIGATGSFKFANACIPTSSYENNCADTIDNDCDNSADCTDSDCTGLPICTPAACTPGQWDITTCGNCGTQTRTCQADSQWGSFGACTGQGVCSSGSTQQCTVSGTPGTQTCSNSCQWGSCVTSGACTPGQTESTTCGNCGTQTRTCQADSQWGNFGACQNEGCTPGTTQCLADRYQICANSCTWQNTGTNADGDAKDFQCGDSLCDNTPGIYDSTKTSTETMCADTLDNDCDSLTDCTDSDCDGSISGAVKNQDNQPIFLADLALSKAAAAVKSATTDALGNYILQSISCGSYTLRASHWNYFPQTKLINLAPNQNLVQDFTLGLGTSCEPDCTYVYDNTVHASCDGVNSCSFYDETARAVCDYAQPGWVRDYDETHYVVCAPGSPQPKTEAKANIACSHGTLVKVTRIVTYKGKPVKLVVATCG